MKKVFTLLLLSACYTSVAAPAVFVGDYKCIGNDPYLNKEYTGTIKVRQKNAVYSIEMKYDTGEKLIGTGGQYNEQLMSVVFQDPKNLKKVGLEQYTFTADKKAIQGYWIYLGQDKLGTETCEKI